MHRLAIAAAAALSLAGCNNDPDQPKTAQEVVAEAGKLARPQPGEYETKVSLLDFSVPGLPPQQAEQMKAMMSKVQEKTNRYCLTRQEAEKGFEDSIRKMTEGNGQMKCDFSKFSVDDGAMDAALTCTGPNGMSADIALDGTASATASAMHMVMQQKAKMIPGGQMRMEMRMESKRVGDCAT